MEVWRKGGPAPCLYWRRFEPPFLHLLDLRFAVGVLDSGGRSDGSGRAKALGGIEVKAAQVDVGEVEFGLALIVAAQADALAGEDFAHVVVVSFVREKAA